MSLRIKTLSAALAFAITGCAAAQHDLGFAHAFTHDLLMAEATPGSIRAFAFAGTPDMLGNSDWTRFMQTEMADGGKVVRDAPYSAEAITETTQMLGDGNRISRKSVALLYRDALGRTRQEQTAPGHTVFINDPVSGKRTVINTEKKSATVLPELGSLGDKIDISKIRELAKSGNVPNARVIHKTINGNTEIIRSADGDTVIQKDGDAQIIRKGPNGEEIIRRGASGDAVVMKKSDDGVTTQIIDEPGRKIIIQRREVTKSDGSKSVEESKDMRISVVRAHDSDEAISIAGLPGDINALINMRTRHKGVTSSLGARDFGGIKADGTQTIATIPAGEIGNDRSIQVVSEKWVSPELQAVVYSRHSDPRSGETIYRLNNIRRTAQSADLFLVPQGFQVKERALPMMATPPAPPTK